MPRKRGKPQIPSEKRKLKQEVYTCNKVIQGQQDQISRLTQGAFDDAHKTMRKTAAICAQNRRLKEIIKVVRRESAFDRTARKEAEKRVASYFATQEGHARYITIICVPSHCVKGRCTRSLLRRCPISLTLINQCVYTFVSCQFCIPQNRMENVTYANFRCVQICA